MAIKASATITLSFMVDIKATYRYYKLQSSTSSTPAAPTTATPATGAAPSGWSDSEPSYTSGSTNTLYFVDLTIFTNDTWLYSKVSKSSSYEAAKEAWNKANAAQDSVNNIEIGGRNLLLNSSELTVTATSTTNFTYTIIYSDLIVGDTYTFSVGSSECTVGTATKYSVLMFDGSEAVSMALFDIDDSKVSKTFVATKPKLIIYAGQVGATAGNSVTYYNLKLEKGNKATDWTPAPEDVQDNINDVYDKLDTKITEQSADIISTAESIIIKASETFVQTGDYEEYKTTLDTQLELLKNQIEARFTSTDSSIQTIDGKVTTEFEKLFTYIRASADGIEIGKSDNPIVMKLDNDDLAFYQNGVKVAYISNNTLQVTDANISTSLKIGSFGFIPRSNGSVDFRKL